MTLTRRLAAGIPAVGVTALAAMAFAGTPAGAATADSAELAALPAVMITTPAPGGYGDGDGEAPAGNDDDRGKPGYGGGQSTKPTTPAPGVSTTPTGGTNTVPPGGESPATKPPKYGPGGGVSAGEVPEDNGVSGGSLALTGAPVISTITMGAVLVAGGTAAIWYTRRRRQV